MEEKSEKILDAATKLFTKYGLSKTTVGEIAHAAGVGKGTVYLYFKTKEDLFCAVVRRHESEIMTKVRAAVRKQDSAEEQLRAFFLTRYQLVQAFLKDHQVSLEILADAKPEVNRTLQEFRHEQQRIVESILEEGCERGELESADLPLFSLAIVAVMNALDQPWIIEGRSLRLKQKVDALVRLVMYGVSAEG